jgi:EpsI family protein
MVACFFLLCAAGVSSFHLSGRHEIVPERLRFISFPANLGPWQGRRPSLLEAEIEQVLKPDDYIVSDFSTAKNDVVNFYVAYYASQRKGYSPHSPIVCIPGGGWQITKFERAGYHSKSLGVTLPLNRVVIARDNNKQLVYYWFVQRGRNVANEYWAKWYLFVDAVTKNRTDGALVRLVTPFYPGESEHAADERLQSFIEQLQPHLRAYLPAETAPNAKSVEHRPAGRQS